MAHDVFISYSTLDKTVADAVCGVLERVGVRCWIAPRDMRPGIDYGEGLLKAIEQVLVLVFSEHANCSRHVQLELERAVSKELAILPFKIDETKPTRSIDYFLSSPHRPDAMTPPLERHLEKLANGDSLES